MHRSAAPPFVGSRRCVGAKAADIAGGAQYFSSRPPHVVSRFVMAGLAVAATGPAVTVVGPAVLIRMNIMTPATTAMDADRRAGRAVGLAIQDDGPAADRARWRHHHHGRRAHRGIHRFHVDGGGPAHGNLERHAGLGRRRKGGSGRSRCQEQQMFGFHPARFDVPPGEIFKSPNPCITRCARGSSSELAGWCAAPRPGLRGVPQEVGGGTRSSSGFRSRRTGSKRFGGF